MPTVYNKRHNTVPDDAVYVGRPTKYGNPYSHQDGTVARFKVATRADAISLYRVYLKSSPELLADARQELRGKDLACWCAPLPCHADVLLELANAEE